MNLLSKPTVGPVVLLIKEKFMFFGDSDNMSVKDAVTGQVTARLQRPSPQRNVLSLPIDVWPEPRCGAPQTYYKIKEKTWSVHNTRTLVDVSGAPVRPCRALAHARHAHAHAQCSCGTASSLRPFLEGSRQVSVLKNALLTMHSREEICDASGTRVVAEIKKAHFFQCASNAIVEVDGQPYMEIHGNILGYQFDLCAASRKCSGACVASLRETASLKSSQNIRSWQRSRYSLVGAYPWWLPYGVLRLQHVPVSLQLRGRCPSGKSR
jgi:hypothetical protein